LLHALPEHFRQLSEALLGISLERREAEKGLIILRTSDVEKARRILEEL
jgi:hypothetical protein